MSVVSLRTQIREDHLTCMICCDGFIKPKALPCLHTFCEVCLRDYVAGRCFEGGGRFPCPVCRADTLLPDIGVGGFPNNHLLSSLSHTVDSKIASKPVPKPRRSLGQVQPPIQVDNEGEASATGHAPTRRADSSSVSPNLPPPYSSVADTNPGLNSSDALAKICENDINNTWMVVPRQGPPAPGEVDESNGAHASEVSQPNNGSETTQNMSSEYCVVSVSQPNADPRARNMSVPYPSSIPGHTSHPGFYPQNQTSDVTSSVNPPIVGWNLSALDSAHSQLGVPRSFSTHSPRDPSPNVGSHLRPASQEHSSSPLYPSVSSVMDHTSTSTACAENMTLKFGKQGSSNRDFLKPTGLAVSKEGHFVISDCGGDQHRIFIYNSEGELKTAFKCGCKVKDIVMTSSNEILAAIQKNISAIRHYTMAGQCKAEYGKFFTYEVPCGIAVLRNGGAVITGTQNTCVYILTNQMKLAFKFGRKGNGDGYFQRPSHVAVNSKNHIIVTDKENNSVQIFNAEGKFKNRFGSTTGSGCAHLQAPLGVCVDANDNIIIADSGNARVVVFSPKGDWLSTVVKNTYELGEKVKPVNVSVTPTGKVAVLLRGPYFAEVRVFTSHHRSISQQAGPVSMSAVWYGK